MESLSLEMSKKVSRCGTSQCGLVGMGVLGQRLDLLISEVFSNLNNSVIP